MTWSTELEELERRLAFARAMGGPEGVERQRQRGKLTVRERAPSDFAVRELRLLGGPAEYAFPAQLTVEADGVTFRDLRPAPDGRLRLPRAVRTRSLRLDVTGDKRILSEGVVLKGKWWHPNDATRFKKLEKAA